MKGIYFIRIISSKFYKKYRHIVGSIIKFNAAQIFNN